MSNNLDDFNAVAEIEAEFWQGGSAEGARQGLTSGFAQGFAHGLPRGLILGQELGESFGCVQAWLALLNAPDLLNPHNQPSDQFLPASLARAKRALLKLQKNIEQFKFDADNDNIIDEFEKIRATFKQVSTMMFPTKATPDL